MIDIYDIIDDNTEIFEDIIDDSEEDIEIE